VSHEPYDKSVNELVCIDLPSGPAFVDRLKKAWDEGDAVFPLDQRLPAVAKATLISAVSPTIILSPHDEVRVAGSHVASGDAIVVATSGSTGNPKAVVLTLDAVIASAAATSNRLQVSQDDAWLACLPPSHVGGLSVITRSLIMGNRLIAVPSFTEANYEDAAKEGATLVSLVATALQRVDPSLYRIIVLGGSKPPTNRPANTVTTYGMTETGSGVVYDGVPLNNVEIEVREKVVFIRCPMMFRCYRDGSSPLDSQGWFRTGDIGSLSTDGVLSIEGREGDLIITGGENVWPEVVESAIISHAYVRDVCVAGVPDPQWGHSVHAWIVISSDNTLTLDELRGHVKETLPAYCAPQQVHFVENIPRTAIGKPQRASLVASLNT